jgi:hypothetical protein
MPTVWPRDSTTEPARFKYCAAFAGVRGSLGTDAPWLAMQCSIVGESAAADGIERALGTVLAAGKVLTRDLGGSAGTAAMAAAIVGHLNRD